MKPGNRLELGTVLILAAITLKDKKLCSKTSSYLKRFFEFLNHVKTMEESA